MNSFKQSCIIDYQASKDFKNLMQQSYQVVWFKRDLRVFDHAPLHFAAQTGKIIPLYVVEPELWSLPDSSPRHWCFMHDCLTDLKQSLMQLRADLIIRVGSMTDILDNLRHTLGTFVLHSHEETGNAWTYNRDKKVADWCLANVILWHQYPTNGVIRRLKTRDKWSRLRNERMQQALISTPIMLRPVENLLTQPLPNKNHPMFGSLAIENVQTGGRTEGLHTLASFLKERGRYYTVFISKPGMSARHCSRLSAHISFGTLSVREIEKATYKKIHALTEMLDEGAMYFRRSLEAFLSRLIWRCHFIQKLEQQPEIEYQCMHPAFEGMREPHFRPDFLEAWIHGQTGYPLIDACMRSLRQNGWINFRMRAMLVSFASYHLWLDWRKTAPLLAQLFTDYEPGIHYSQFQMQSGVTGINTIRIYNPIKQSYEHDPDGKFIRRYVPELATINPSFIHEPWLTSNSAKHYPAPLIEHEIAMKHARKEISLYQQTSDFHVKSKIVLRKLGSRRKPTIKRSKTSHKPIQLSFDF
jgi:deoxyribodipyrimidine photo-lyase